MYNENVQAAAEGHLCAAYRKVLWECIGGTALNRASGEVLSACKALHREGCRMKCVWCMCVVRYVL
jgi:hypothetical protein